MQTYRLQFNYARKIAVYLQAEDADAIHDFLEDHPDWDLLEDAPEIIDEDDTDPNDGDGDPCDEYELTEVDGVVASYCIHEGEIREVEEAE